LSGDIVTFVIEVVNTGQNAATGVVVQDFLPPSIQYLTSSLLPVSQNPVSWNIGSLQRGQIVSIILTGRLITQLPAGS
jgi:uncharacterized repeat protein (TIGR01451 family)